MDSPPFSSLPDPLDVPLAWAVLLPLLLLCTPLLVGVPTPLAAGAGAVLLATLPALLICLARRAPSRPAWTLWRPALFALLLAAMFQATRAQLPFDSFAADRFVMLLTSGCSLAWAASQLGTKGRAVLARGSLLASLALLAYAVADTLLDPERSYAGSLENTGHLAAAALPGAVIAACSLFERRGAVRILAALAALGFAIYVTWVPVWGAALAFALALLTWIVASPGQRDRRGALATLLVLLLSFGIGRLSASAGAGPTEDQAVSQADPYEVGGASFRTLTWGRLDDILFDHLWLGVGPGQFEAAFPPYRDPHEIELSTFGRTAPFETQVEHPHNDWFLPAIELGLPLGLVWLVFLIATTWRALHTLRADGEPSLGVAWIALAAYAFVGGVFFGAAASSVLGLALAGALWGGQAVQQQDPLPKNQPTNWGQRLFPVALILLIVGQAQRAWAFLDQGRGLRALRDDRIAMTLQDGEEILGHDGEMRRELLQSALLQVPDAPVVLAEWADWQRRSGASVDEQSAAWSRLLGHQPQRFEALLAMGNLAARTGRLQDARQWYLRARDVDARHPALLRNEIEWSLESPVLEGDGGALGEALDRFFDGRDAEGLSEKERAWLLQRGAKALLAGRLRAAGLLFERVDPRRVVTSGEQAYQLSQEFDGSDSLASDAFLACAHQLWGREHADGRSFDAAVRSYRQSLRASRHDPRHAPYGALVVRLELVAALWEAGEQEKARAEMEGALPGVRTLRELPPWVGDSLLRAGLLQP